MVMAVPISTSTFLCTSSASLKSSTYSSSSLVSYPKTSNSRFSTRFPQLDPSLFSQWSGLKNLGISISPKSLKFEKKGRCKSKVVHASLFGVGVPEALVIGAVALLVFGPKGLAEVARTLGKTLREFQPAIRELQEASREFKSTLDREIGLEEMSSSTQKELNGNSFNPSNSTPTPVSVASTEESGTKADLNGTPSTKEAYASEEYLKITEEYLKASTSQQQGQTAPPGERQLESEKEHEATAKETVAAMPQSWKPESET